MSPAAELLRARAGRVDVVDVPEFVFASVQGGGSPQDPSFAAGIAALYPIAYGVRFALRGRARPEKVAPLEALWWSTSASHQASGSTWIDLATVTPPAAWNWQLQIRLPDAATMSLVEEVRQDAARRHPEHARQLERVEIGSWREGLAAQVLHVGPYGAESETVRLLMEFIATHGYRPSGRHHEIYLSDPRRCAPERLRTLLRQPITAA